MNKIYPGILVKNIQEDNLVQQAIIFLTPYSFHIDSYSTLCDKTVLISD